MKQLFVTHLKGKQYAYRQRRRAKNILEKSGDLMGAPCFMALKPG